MAQSRRLSQSYTTPRVQTDLSSSFTASAPPDDVEAWQSHWKSVFARDIIDSRVVTVDAQTSVEDACDILLSADISCLAVKSDNGLGHQSVTCLFDFSDVNAFLTLAATKRIVSPGGVQDNHRVDEIFAAARAGHVPVHLVGNLSEKNPLETLPYDSSLVSLLEIFARGTHRVLIRSNSLSEEFVGIVSDRRLLSWFASYAQETVALQLFLSSPLTSHIDSLPSIGLYSSVVAASSTDSVLEAMRLMSEEGVSSLAVLDEESGFLLSAISVTDIGKIVVPSESNHILSTLLLHFISFIKAPDGSTDGADKYPVYSVLPTSTLLYTIQKLLATNAHRVFVTRESTGSSPILSSSSSGNLTGIVSIVDILSLFARLANVRDVDPTRMQRHRRASSVSSQSSDHDIHHSRSNSRTGLRRSASNSVKVPPSARGRGSSSVSSGDSSLPGQSTESLKRYP